MKAKLSAISLALLPVLATASVEISSDGLPSHKTDSIIVVYKEGTTLRQRSTARDLVVAKISDLDDDEIDDKYRHILDGRMANFKLDKVSVKDAIKKLQSHPAVLYAELDYMVKADVLTDDPGLADLWGLHNTGQAGGTVDADIDAPEAWDISTGDSSIVIGVIDTGVNYSHPDLINNMWTNPGEIPDDGIDNDNNGYVDDVYGIDTVNGDSDPMDDQGHGSHVSGTIGAEGNNAEGVVGVNWDISIAGCKFLAADGFGSTSGAIACIDYFVALKQSGVNIRALNNSWGGGGFEQSLADAITAAGDADILFVAAAGNDGVDNDSNPHYPSSYDNDNVLAVASTTRTDGDSGYSYGLTSVDMGAPGSAIVSTVLGSGYASYSGTSMATPHVAGAAGLVWSVNPDLTALETKALLMESGDENAFLSGKTVSGKRLNVNNALLDADPTPSFKFSVSPTNVTLTAGETAVYTFDVGAIADWDGDVELALTDPSGLGVLSASTVSPGDSFTLTVDTFSDTQWGDYSFTVTGTSGDLERSKTLGLYVYPQGLNDFTYSNETPVAIPPNEDDPNDLGVDSVITIADDITVFGSSTYINITHTYRGDLILKLTSPAGTVATLAANTGGSNQDINESFSSAAFNGESTLGDWTLNVTDVYNGDNGTLNEWAVTFTGLGDVAPAPPAAGFDVEIDGLSVDFTDTSTDVNGDIVSWAWDFGDGTTSTEQNPSHVFSATGAYTVMLTVTDAEGHTDSTSMSVSVSSTDIELTVDRAYKSRLGNLRVDLSWEGSSSDMVDVYRNGVLLETVENNGVYRDRERRVTGNSFTYMICDETTACSIEKTVNF